jgi:5-methylcytosine-specific restriction endonuclease McrA
MLKPKAYRLPTSTRERVQIARRQAVTAKREIELLRRFVWCASCNALLTGRSQYVFDHFISLELGGKDDADNLRPLCLSCNALKTAIDLRLIAKAKRLAGEVQKNRWRRRS